MSSNSLPSYLQTKDLTIHILAINQSITYIYSLSDYMPCCLSLSMESRWMIQFSLTSVCVVKRGKHKNGQNVIFCLLIYVSRGRGGKHEGRNAGDGSWWWCWDVAWNGMNVVAEEVAKSSGLPEIPFCSFDTNIYYVFSVCPQECAMGNKFFPPPQ